MQPYFLQRNLMQHLRTHDKMKCGDWKLNLTGQQPTAKPLNHCCWLLPIQSQPSNHHPPFHPMSCEVASICTVRNITKTFPCNVYPIEPYFYIVKMGYAGVYLFFVFLLQNLDCGYMLEPPQPGGSNMYPQSMF